MGDMGDLTHADQLRARSLRAHLEPRSAQPFGIVPEKLMRLSFDASTLFQPLTSTVSQFRSSFWLTNEPDLEDPDLPNRSVTNPDDRGWPFRRRHVFPRGRSVLRIPVAQIEKPEPPRSTLDTASEGPGTTEQESGPRDFRFGKSQASFANVFLDPLKPHRHESPLELGFASESLEECQEHQSSANIRSSLLAADIFGLTWSKTDRKVEFSQLSSNGCGLYLFGEVHILWQLLQVTGMSQVAHLRDRWREKTEEARSSMIRRNLMACPGYVISSHGSDTDALYTALTSNSLRSANRLSALRSSEAANTQPRITTRNVTIPQLNLQDLVQGDRVLLLLQTRLESWPGTFLWQNLNHSRLERLCLNQGREVDTSLRIFLTFSTGVNCPYAPHSVAVTDQPDSNSEHLTRCSSFSWRDYIHAMKIEKTILLFLWSWVEQLLTDTELDRIIGACGQGPSRLGVGRMAFVRNHRSGNFQEHLLNSQYKSPLENIHGTRTVLVATIGALRVETEALRKDPSAFLTQARHLYIQLKLSRITPRGLGPLRQSLRSNDTGLCKIAIATTALEKYTWLVALQRLEASLNRVVSRGVEAEKNLTSAMEMRDEHARHLKGAISDAIFLRKLCEDQLANMLLDYEVFRPHFNASLLPTGEVLRTRVRHPNRLADILDATINRSEFDHRFGAWRKIELIEKAISLEVPKDSPLPDRFVGMLRIMYCLALVERELATYQPWVMAANCKDTQGLTNAMKTMLNHDIIEEILLEDLEFKYPNFFTRDATDYVSSALHDPDDRRNTEEPPPALDIMLIMRNQLMEVDLQMFWHNLYRFVEGATGLEFEELFPTGLRDVEPWVTVGTAETQEEWYRRVYARYYEEQGYLFNPILLPHREGNIDHGQPSRPPSSEQDEEAGGEPGAALPDLAEGEEQDEPEVDEPEAAVPAPIGEPMQQAAPANQLEDASPNLTPEYLNRRDLRDIHACFGIGSRRLRRVQFERLMGRIGFAHSRESANSRFTPMRGDAAGKPSMAIHLPHGNEHVEPHRMRDYGNTMRDMYGWTAAKFSHTSERPANE